MSERQKQRLREAKTNENADTFFTDDKQLLTEEQLGSVAGGGHDDECCSVCGIELSSGICPICSREFGFYEY